jgi:hypothetical protein
MTPLAWETEVTRVTACAEHEPQARMGEVDSKSRHSRHRRHSPSVGIVPPRHCASVRCVSVWSKMMRARVHQCTADASLPQLLPLARIRVSLNSPAAAYLAVAYRMTTPGTPR